MVHVFTSSREIDLLEHGCTWRYRSILQEYAGYILEPSRDGEYMVIMLRGYSEYNKGYNIKGIVSIAKYQKGTVGISL